MIACTFENGNNASLRHVVVDAIVTKDKQILLIKRATHLSNGDKWATPGGFLDRDETCEQAVKREVKEETGLDVKSVKLFKIIDNPNRKNENRQNIAFVYQIEFEGEVKVQESEVAEARWFDFDKLPDEADFAFDHFEIIREFYKHS
ncbi:MAG: ADP-ribose diphosphatase [Candidatus Curtissbacteria bacterium GW2011_GWA1_40_9]|uniref:ADP-ribose diphosphatase n=1 Tax=Candidatus Curtissbacteria bacterium GW2011_GWA1_40_9 TaxID=1618408 RepID=A0A0G0W0V1_9BACT|nr:MAG: ADP-ribose diphosphatase [Candidatus Curtissbacteria bacterium GW2011_GWA1_40_9]